MSATSSRLDKERELYRELLALARCSEPSELVDGALALLVGATGARDGYVEVRAVDGKPLRAWASTSQEPARVEQIQDAISTGIIAQALESGETVLTGAAVDDPRFEELESVREKKIESVLCAPIGDRPARGVVYLQGRKDHGRPRFGRDEKELLSTFVKAIEPVAERLTKEGNTEKEDILVASSAMQEVVQKLPLLARLQVTLLLTGPTGAGKSWIAKVLHRLSERQGAFVELNCAAIPEALFESELFGAERGAHSAAAHGAVVGKIEAAEGGTLLLDEIGELSLASQAKLLQFLQSGSYHSLGSNQARTSSAKVIAATNRDLKALTDEGAFRTDLYYRLAVLELHISGLEERVDDILPIARRAAREACDRHGFAPKLLSAEAEQLLMAQSWPGNVRELVNRIEAAAIGAELRQAKRIEPQDVFAGSDNAEAAGWQEATRRFQGRLLRSTLEATDWNVSEAARRLGLARSYLYSLMDEHELKRKKDAR